MLFSQGLIAKNSNSVHCKILVKQQFSIMFLLTFSCKEVQHLFAEIAFLKSYVNRPKKN